MPAQEISLLTTKLYIPQPRPNLVPRPHLIERLDEGLRRGHRLTLVSAPPGFGKTTLVTDWVCASAREVAWISLDEGDNDPVQFLNYLVAALQQVDGNIGRTIRPVLRSPGFSLGAAASLQSLVTPLINEFLGSQSTLLDPPWWPSATCLRSVAATRGDRALWAGLCLSPRWWLAPVRQG